MTKKNLLIVALILIILALGSRYLSKSSGSKSQDPKIGQTIGGDFKIDQLDSIVIQSVTGQIHLIKAEGQWILKEKDGFPANMSEIIGLVEKISSHKISSLVTQRTERYGEFQVQSMEESGGNPATQGSSLAFSADQKELFTIILGKQRPMVNVSPSGRHSGGGTYLRYASEDKVYLIKENLVLSSDADRWMDQTLFALEKDQIKTLKLKSKDVDLSFQQEKESKKFSISDLATSEKFKVTELNPLLEQLASLKFQNYTALSEEKGMKLKLAMTVSVDLNNGSQLTFQILTEKIDDADEYWFKITSLPKEAAPHGELSITLADSWLFQVAEYQAKNWIKTRKDFVTP